MELATPATLRFILLHELAHRRYHHLLLATLASWAYVATGLAACGGGDWPAGRRGEVGSPLYLPWLALFFTAWMVAGQPLHAYLGRAVGIPGRSALSVAWR